MAGIRKRLVAMTAAGGLVAVGVAIAPVTHALATSNACTDGDNDVYSVVVDNATGFTIGLELGELGTGPLGHVALCVATDHYGQTAPTPVATEIAVDVLSGPIYSNPTGNAANMSCANDPNAQVTVTCASGSNPTLIPVPGACGSFACGGTAILSVPYSTCVGTNLTGVSCSNGAQGVGSTGLLVAGLNLTPPPPGTVTGAGVSVTTLTLWVDGIPVPLAGALLSGGVNLSAVGAGTGSGVWAGTQSGVPAAEVDLGGVVVPVTLPTNCVAVLQPSCPAPY
jgi:hypothetical protein